MVSKARIDKICVVLAAIILYVGKTNRATEVRKHQGGSVRIRAMSFLGILGHRTDEGASAWAAIVASHIYH